MHDLQFKMRETLVINKYICALKDKTICFVSLLFIDIQIASGCIRNYTGPGHKYIWFEDFVSLDI